MALQLDDEVVDAAKKLLAAADARRKGSGGVAKAGRQPTASEGCRGPVESTM